MLFVVVLSVRVNVSCVLGLCLFVSNRSTPRASVTMSSTRWLARRLRLSSVPSCFLVNTGRFPTMLSKVRRNLTRSGSRGRNLGGVVVCLLPQARFSCVS